jgi:endonuclease/exonuclease/phosphatase family metal-dependent hydrolase
LYRTPVPCAAAGWRPRRTPRTLGEPVKVTIATWNLQGRPPAQLGLAERVWEWSADILLLQEADGNAIAAELAGYQAQLWWPTAGTAPGMVIASRLPVSAQGLLDALEPWDKPRVAWAELRPDEGSEITAVNVHLKAPVGPWPPAARATRDRQRRALGDWLRGLGPFVVGGDFNTREPSLDGAVASAFHSAEPTWRPLGWRILPPLLRLDAFFVGPGLEIERSNVDQAAIGSDHQPVVAEVSDRPVQHKVSLRK